MSGASPQTLLLRVTYGGRKGRRAWLRLGKYGLLDLYEAGITVCILDSDEPEPEGPRIVFRWRAP